MTTSILARVRRVMRGHSDRALIVAVDEAGLEYKIEVPLEAVRGVGEVGEHVLMLAWSLHALPPAPQPQAPSATPAGPPGSGAPVPAAPVSTTATANSTRPTPGAVDEQFMALMSRNASASASAPAAAGPETSPGEGPAARPEQQLATLLGIGRAPT